MSRVDSICLEVAQYFLQDEPELRADVGDLARHIQEAVEDWIEMAKQEREHDNRKDSP